MKLQRVTCLVFLALVLVAPSFAQGPLIRAGTDIFDTRPYNGTKVDFSGDPIPAGFFCPGSPVFTGTIELEGESLQTIPAGIALGADTAVERLADVDLSSGFGVTPLVARAVSLRGSQLLPIQCNAGEAYFEVRACSCGPQPITQMQLTLTDPAAGCGVADGDLSINVCMSFTNTATGQTVGPLFKPVNLQIAGMRWCQNGAPGSVAISTAFHVATKCAANNYIAVRGTSNFYPGQIPGSGLSCLDIWGFLTTCHSSYGSAPHEHCVNPVCCPEGQSSCK